MDPVESNIIETFNCHPLEARELVTTVHTLADHFVTVYDAFSLDAVIDTQRAVERAYQKTLEPNNGQSVFFDRSFEVSDRRLEGHIKRSRRALPSRSRKLWKAYQAADEADAPFRLAAQPLFPCDYGFDGILTHTLSQLHQAERLTAPEKVIEGRAACEALGRQVYLLRSLGLCHIYYGYDHTYRPPRW